MSFYAITCIVQQAVIHVEYETARKHKARTKEWKSERKKEFREKKAKTKEENE